MKSSQLQTMLHCGTTKRGLPVTTQVKTEKKVNAVSTLNVSRCLIAYFGFITDASGIFAQLKKILNKRNAMGTCVV